MKRRRMVLFAACVAAASVAHAQSRTRLSTVGILSFGVIAKRFLDAFRKRLGELGYVDGRNVRIELLEASGHSERLAQHAARLAALPADVIVAEAVQAAKAAREATGRVPIVMMHAADPVGAGLIDNLRRPGGNVTGTVSLTPEIVGKLLELVRELNGNSKRAAILYNPGNPSTTQWLKNAEDAAQRIGIDAQPIAVENERDLPRAFAAMERDGADALVALADPLLALHKASIVDFAKARGMTDVYAITQIVRDGGLAGYSPVFADHWVRGAEFVARILSGEQASDMPVEQPARFELVINLRRARAMGLAISPVVHARADELVE